MSAFHWRRLAFVSLFSGAIGSAAYADNAEGPLALPDAQTLAVTQQPMLQAQAAAVAALADDAFLARSYELNLRGMQQLTEAFDALGLEYVPSVGNFVLVKVGPAAKVYQELLKRGVIVRPVANYGLPEWLRITVGLPQENEAFLRALPEALAAARG
jgi:histidinol-phosphate/aromatic aminotransferase/cobyric acid decarboxylase-like protein